MNERTTLADDSSLARLEADLGPRLRALLAAIDADHTAPPVDATDGADHESVEVAISAAGGGRRRWGLAALAAALVAVVAGLGWLAQRRAEPAPLAAPPAAPSAASAVAVPEPSAAPATAPVVPSTLIGAVDLEWAGGQYVGVTLADGGTGMCLVVDAAGTVGGCDTVEPPYGPFTARTAGGLVYGVVPGGQEVDVTADGTALAVAYGEPTDYAGEQLRMFAADVPEGARLGVVPMAANPGGGPLAGGVLLGDFDLAGQYVGIATAGSLADRTTSICRLSGDVVTVACTSGLEGYSPVAAFVDAGGYVWGAVGDGLVVTVTADEQPVEVRAAGHAVVFGDEQLRAFVAWAEPGRALTVAVTAADGTEVASVVPTFSPSM